MKEDVISEILRAENDYNYALSSAVKEAEQYAAEARAQQSAWQDKLRQDFRHFEKAERDRFEETLSESMRKMDEENTAAKELMRTRQQKKAGEISDRLKEEVLSLYGDS